MDIDTTEKRFVLYMHKNKVNGKKYIGITSQVPEHRWLNGNGYDKDLCFGRAIAKYGWDGFEHIILKTDLTEDDAKRLEVEYIAKYATNDRAYGYNMTIGGDGVNGFKHSEASKKKMSVAKIGKKHGPESVETRLKISEALTGNKNCLGYKHTDEARARISKSKFKPVASYQDGVLIHEYSSAKEAECKTGISRKNISLCCKGQRKHAGGYAWCFT